MVREELLYATESFSDKYVPVKSLKTTKTTSIHGDLWCKNVPATSIFHTKQVSKPTSDTLMETPNTSILQPAKRYSVGQATSDSKGSSTPGLTYSSNVPNERKVHVPQPQIPPFIR